MSDQLDIFGYRILAPVGEGAASTLYAVQEVKSGQVWALKHVVKRTDKEQRFLDQVEQEYMVGSKLDHPNLRRMERIHRKRKLFRVIELGLLMELVDAPSLDAARPDTILECVLIFEQIANALHHMHEKGFVHADMKPTNVLVADGAVKVIDLGQACAIGTIKKRIQGTPGYIAPEQAHRRKVTVETDVYNFGATMHWVLTGRVIPTALPPRRGQEEAFSRAIESGRIAKPPSLHEANPQIPQDLSSLVLECVQVGRSSRPSSMEMVAIKLRQIADSLS